MKYTWRAGSRVRLDAEKVGNRLDFLAQKMGSVKPADVVKDARRKTSPYHAYFDWDIRQAAKKHWISQAKEILRFIAIVDESNQEAEPIRAFVNISIGENYTNIVKVMSEKDSRDLLLAKAWSELEIWRKRYEQFVEFAAVFEAMKKVG